IRFSTVGSPVPFSDLIGNKLVGSFGIWHPQERLSQRAERHSFGTAHAIFLEELESGRAHACTPVTNAHLVCSLLLEKIKLTLITTPYRTTFYTDTNKDK